MALMEGDIFNSWIDIEPDNYRPGSINDLFDGSRYVAKLTNETFNDFIKQKDAAMVMFYDPRDVISYHSKKHVVMAASATFRQNRAYAGVNCIKESELCAREEVTTLPLFKIYSRGQLMSTMKECNNFTAELMMKQIATCPVLSRVTTPEPAKCNT